MNRKDIEVIKEDGSKIKIFVSSPSVRSVQKADIYRAKIWNECLDEGIKTKEELNIFMEKRGIWGESQKNKEKEIVNQISNLEKELFLGNGKKKIPLSDGTSIAIKMRSLRNALRKLLLQKSNFEQNTAESIADNARFDYLVSCCTFYENGQNVYKNIDDYNDKASDNISFSAAAALAEMMYDYDQSSEHNLPENQWLQHFNLVNDDLSLVNDKSELVDLDGRKINQFGHYIDDEGNRIDINGNKLDQNGNYVIQADYDISTKKTRTTTSKTRSTRKVKTESK